MKIKINKVEVIRSSQNLNEMGYQINYSIFNNGVTDSLQPMTLKEIKELRDALDNIIYNQPNTNPWLEPDSKH